MGLEGIIYNLVFLLSFPFHNLSADDVLNTLFASVYVS